MNARLLPDLPLHLSPACDRSTCTGSSLGSRSPAHSPMIKDRKLGKTLAVTAMAISLAGAAHAATATFSTAVPIMGPIIISNLVGHVGYDGTGTDPGPQSNVDDPKYVAYD